MASTPIGIAHRNVRCAWCVDPATHEATVPVRRSRATYGACDHHAGVWRQDRDALVVYVPALVPVGADR